MVFEPASLEQFSTHYPGAPAVLRHGLAGHPLLSVERLTQLACALPEKFVEYNSGDLPIAQDPALTPMNGLSAKETVRRIAENQSWIVLKNIEQYTEYAALLQQCLADIAPVVESITGAMHRPEGFVFVSSPRAVTPFHMDPEHNILMQVAGVKTFTIFPAGEDEIANDEDHEAFHQHGGHRNLLYKEDYASHGRAIALAPGDALYAPVKSPHWVKVGPDISVSLSITWRSALSEREAHLRRANGWLRARGLGPPAPGRFPLRDRAAVLAARVASRLKHV